MVNAAKKAGVTNESIIADVMPENKVILKGKFSKNAKNSIVEVNWRYENKEPSTFKEWLESSIIVKRKEVSNKSKVA